MPRKRKTQTAEDKSAPSDWIVKSHMEIEAGHEYRRMKSWDEAARWYYQAAKTTKSNLSQMRYESWAAYCQARKFGLNDELARQVSGVMSFHDHPDHKMEAAGDVENL